MTGLSLYYYCIRTTAIFLLIRNYDLVHYSCRGSLAAKQELRMRPRDGWPPLCLMAETWLRLAPSIDDTVTPAGGLPRAAASVR